MSYVKCEFVMDGPGPDEKIVRVQEADDTWEEVVASRNSLLKVSHKKETASGQWEDVVIPNIPHSYLLETSSVLQRTIGGRILVELNSESVSGKWRLWVPEDNVLP